MNADLLKQLETTRTFLRSRVKNFPKIAIVLGSGLSGLLENLEVETEISYAEIPHMRAPSVEGHVGRLLVGKLKGTRVACLQGRLHFYEGIAMSEVVFPFRALAYAGAEIFLLTNAAGGLHAKMKPADLMLIEDHINLMGTNPLIGDNVERLGTRFPDLTGLYDPALSKVFIKAAKKLDIKLRTGVYVGIHGPSYETPAEIRMYRMMGADVVGMSTVPEAIALRHMGKKVVAISCITNLAAGVTKTPLDHAEVLENAKKVQSKFAKLVVEAITEIRETDERSKSN